MAHRKEVFQSKVLQKFYPATSKLETDHSPPSIVEALAKKPHVKRKTSEEDSGFGDAGKAQSAANPGRRMYTVLPPPADYNIHSEESVTLPQLESINSAEDPAEESVHEGNEELEEQKRRRRRRRKRKPAEEDGAATMNESSAGQTPVDEGGERISRNKKRKLKKKRHKEKLHSMGLMPRAAALEFIYQKDGAEEEEEEEEEVDNERRAAEVSDFLRTTTEIYMSDSSLHVVKVPHLSATVDDLLGSIASGCKPDSVLKQLYSLKVFVQQNERDKLEKELKELNNSSMSAEETAAVVSLFQYWITDILPMQGDKKTRLSTTHP